MTSDRAFNYSFTFWVYPRGAMIDSGSIFRYGNNDSVRAPGVWGIGAVKLQFAIDAVTRDNCLWESTAFTLNVWAHVAIIVNTNQMLIYKNGVSVGQVDMRPFGGRKTYPPQNLFGGDDFYLRTCICHLLQFY